MIQSAVMSAAKHVLFSRVMCPYFTQRQRIQTQTQNDLFRLQHCPTSVSTDRNQSVIGQKNNKKNNQHENGSVNAVEGCGPVF